jgi:hypothetical protein
MPQNTERQKQDQSHDYPDLRRRDQACERRGCKGDSYGPLIHGMNDGSMSGLGTATRRNPDTTNVAGVLRIVHGQCS